MHAARRDLARRASELYDIFDENPISAATQYITRGANQNDDVTNAKAGTSSNGQLTLAQIQEATSNIERSTNNQNIKTSLAEAIRSHGKKEKTLRQSTISCNNENIDTKEISNTIDEEWVFKSNQAPVTYWNDKKYLHCQFINNEAKLLFMASNIPSMPQLLNRIMPMNDQGEHFRRRPVRIIINNLRPSINAEKVIAIIKNCTDFDTEITEIRDGSPHPITKTRSLFFRINAHGLRILIDKMDGEIPYADKDTKVKARLRAKINCKPWQCKQCFMLGIHECPGKRCKNCANKDHLTKDCPSGLRFCGNCKKKGHRSTDLHCPAFLNEVAKEIRKMDIPMEMFEVKESRLNLAKCIQLK